MGHRRWALSLATVLVLFAGCGDGAPEGVAPRDWARQVCTGFSGWLEAVAAASDGLRDAATAEPREVQAALVGFLSDSTARTDDLLETVSDAGTPAVEDGDQLSQDFRRAVEEIRDGFARTRERAASLPADEPRAFQEGVADVASDLRNARQRLQNRLDQVEEDYDSPELVNALESEPSCSRVYRPG